MHIYPRNPFCVKRLFCLYFAWGWRIPWNLTLKSIKFVGYMTNFVPVFLSCKK
jgi:hypothetical protein